MDEPTILLPMEIRNIVRSIAGRHACYVRLELDGYTRKAADSDARDPNGLMVLASSNGYS
jgi:hypothetical protein